MHLYCNKIVDDMKHYENNNYRLTLLEAPPQLPDSLEAPLQTFGSPAQPASRLFEHLLSLQTTIWPGEGVLKAFERQEGVKKALERPEGV
jgi:hypothetical protein